MATEIFEELQRTFDLSMDAKTGNLSPEAQTHEFHLGGDDKAEALGHAYHIRDMIRDAGRECEANYIEKSGEPNWSSEPMHLIEIRIEPEE